MQLGQKQYDASASLTDALGPLRATLQDIVAHVTPHDPAVGGTTGAYTLQMSVDGLTFVDLGTVGDGSHFFHVNAPFVRVVPSTVPTDARSVRVSIFETGLPITAPSGDIVVFRGEPKTPGFPHYLDGLPMSVVSQLGYVDRGVGVRGIASFVEDFICWPSKPLNPYGFRATDVDELAGNSSAWIYFYNGWGMGLSHFGVIAAYSYTSGAVRLATFRAHDDSLLGVVALWADGWNAAASFRAVLGRQMWYSTRVAVEEKRNPGNNAIAVGVFRTSFWGLAGGDSNNVVQASKFTITDDAEQKNQTGLYFYKTDTDPDWSFVALGQGSNPRPRVVIPNLVQTATGSAFQYGKYYPLSFRVAPDGGVIVYVDGLVAGTIAADNAVMAAIMVDEPTDESEATMGPGFALEAVPNADDDADVALRVDNVLMAQETNADPD